MPLSFDIFCKVVDNYGDIGVCWRLARRLADLGEGRVRLWVDDLRSFSRIAPAVGAGHTEQTVDGVHILRWHDTAATGPDTVNGTGSNALHGHGPAAGDFTTIIPADVVIEAFACSPPAAYIERMSDRQVWVNLEYLSAEPWVESCHALPSLQPNGLRKFFFFPGFTPGTGGLLRETALLEQRDRWQADPDARLQLLAQLGVESSWRERLSAGASLVYVYCYPEAPLESLIEALAEGQRDTLVLRPDGIRPLTLPAGHTRRSHVALHSHPFVDQDVFDRLLWSSDLNVVRGEDSLVRALWAGRPMIWQPYLQADDAHLDKLEAWLVHSPFSPEIRGTMRAWNRSDAAAVKAMLTPLLQAERLKAWQHDTQTWCTQLAQRDDLAAELARFCAKNAQTR